ncbi:NAD(P)/FAD-dependent oxidoreductase [Colwellia hornerae]|uniref:NAD(P)/FAD-dependent oxidoreductase n=1 Tax=Colwellia hornerae TaxID=89402 RepID=A0A5C6QBF7_9GAMM|nr:NAD(P)/FAD-dependent oxidoreductase [Colwellia hornerae]TWX55216.1 NAD(P)/FAD-dependent oxidoreductase [Colwellia hornerae]TWX61216.1 NAD(P)/FAD-dependent oxidoreductase [Colwellia hornerae]TWX66434.1 NAD(P)/FAD-dependent oxidoreductase [Colwellia hornerae]
MEKVDAIIIGAGVVGLAIAAKLSETLNNVLIIDKNSSFGEETSSRNSEVIHAGIYYPQGSLKAKLCVQGKEKIYQYCQKRNIPHQRLGKLLVAHGNAEEKILTKTLKQAVLNGVHDLTWLTESELKNSAPALHATAALLSPSTGIIDAHSYMQGLLADIEYNNGQFVGRTRFIAAEQDDSGFIVTLNSQEEIMQLHCDYLINAGGLHCTKVAENIIDLAKVNIPKLYYCRGHYFSYQGKSPFKQLIYPVPQAHGLGIHASLDIGGQLKFGPDTQYIDNINYQVSADLKAKFVAAIQRYYPDLDVARLHADYSGIRPKLEGPFDGFKDFIIESEKEHGLKGLVNLFGIDSPGLTSSLAIAEYVREKLAI